jgi:streptogramin lyase
VNKSVLLGLIAIPIAYLLLWPVPVDPVAWDAPQDPGLVDPFAENNRLRPARPINLDIYEGPEDIASPDDGFFYAATASGSIVRFRANGTGLEQFADVGGRPLGIEFDADGYLLVANAYRGLQRISPRGAVELLAHE